MKRTKEFDVFVRDEIKLPINGFWCQNIQAGGYNIKAKLIIEMPEKYITITETDFDDAISSLGCSNFSYLREKLFGEDK
jgi:hypothetical protein